MDDEIGKYREIFGEEGRYKKINIKSLLPVLHPI